MGEKEDETTVPYSSTSTDLSLWKPATWEPEPRPEAEEPYAGPALAWMPHVRDALDKMRAPHAGKFTFFDQNVGEMLRDVVAAQAKIMDRVECLKFRLEEIEKKSRTKQ